MHFPFLSRRLQPCSTCFPFFLPLCLRKIASSRRLDASCERRRRGRGPGVGGQGACLVRTYANEVVDNFRRSRRRHHASASVLSALRPPCVASREVLQSGGMRRRMPVSLRRRQERRRRRERGRGAPLGCPGYVGARPARVPARKALIVPLLLTRQLRLVLPLINILARRPCH